jgi:LmbE family N-acetylglucosaminyl deacetylase
LFGKRILLLVAHPDDEVVGFSASIRRAQAAGAQVAALYLTHGCIARAAMWPWDRKNYDRVVAVRRAEGEAAARRLGLEILGWSPRPARFLWREMAQVNAEIAAAVAAWKPDQLWVPAYEGGNPDHDALNALGFSWRGRLSVLEFAEYNFVGGATCSQTFVSADSRTRVIALTPEEEAAKRQDLLIYESEGGNLDYVRVRQESFRPLTGSDYARPPHVGTLFYARFRWVPFRHPRVDFTDPAEVSAAIVKFLSTPGL